LKEIMAMLIETLEGRRMLTVVSATFDAGTGTLTIVGNDKRDIIEVTPLTGGGVTASYDGSDVDFPGKIKLISISTGGGGDIISLATIVGIPISVNAGGGGDFIQGGSDKDTLKGGGDDDVIIGGAGNDVIDGGQQGDLLVGGIGDDTIIAGSSNQNDDTITGGKGDDVVDYSRSTTPVFIAIGALQPPPNESDKIYGDVNKIVGSPFVDEISNGTKRGMRIDGGAGNDTLTGGSGNDTLIGGAGNNPLNGMGGNDTFNLNGSTSNTVDGGSGIDSVLGSGSGADAVTNVP
jgi:Ca2+-binding RTX toxin-like protein